MNSFTENWLISTLASDSIANIKTNDETHVYLDAVINEDRAIKVLVLSNDEHVLAIGKSFDVFLASPTYTFTEAVAKVAELLQLDRIAV